MKLTTKDSELFFDLMWSLQFFVNETLKIVEGVYTREQYLNLSHEEKFLVRESVYEHPELIEQYVSKNPHQFNDDRLAIIKQWKKFVRDDFYIERYLKNHAILINDKNVYGVLALHDGFDEMFPKNYLPVYIRAVLLPFQGKIVYDGLMQGYNVYFGGGVKNSLKENYMRAKLNGKIITSLEDNKTQSKKTKKVKKSKDWSNEIEQLMAISKKLKGGDGQPMMNSAVFSLLKTSIELANKTLTNPSDKAVLFEELRKAKNSVRKVENILYRIE